jgi:hypothetical protein
MPHNHTPSRISSSASSSSASSSSSSSTTLSFAQAECDDDPLSMNENSAWAQFHEQEELRKEIKKDLER